MIYSYYFYLAAAVLPAFFLTYSSTYLIPFPLYGSGFLSDLIRAATAPTNCLSTPNNVTIGALPFSVSAVTFNSEEYQI